LTFPNTSSHLPLSVFVFFSRVRQVNPFQRLPHLYDHHMMDQYQGMQLGGGAVQVVNPVAPVPRVRVGWCACMVFAPRANALV
jgi:hypothetical protein